ncbi:MAG: hemerythrin domain-containing protein [Campylobacterota bacterium]|nr:hemerythrin domain-containing protein [Campylobacterota bacterium]
MADIRTFLTQDHRECDVHFSAMENIANAGTLADATEMYKKFAEATEHHFQMEERVMFPAFEQKTGMLQGPTQMMRQEHTQIRGLINEISEAIEADDRDKFFGLTETMMIMLQQHNMKEEQMLYSMAQQHLNADAALIIDMMESMITE